MAQLWWGKVGDVGGEVWGVHPDPWNVPRPGPWLSYDSFKTLVVFISHYYANWEYVVPEGPSLTSKSQPTVSPTASQTEGVLQGPPGGPPRQEGESVWV